MQIFKINEKDISMILHTHGHGVPMKMDAIIKRFSNEL